MDILVRDRVVRVFTEVALEREVLWNLVLELRTDGAPDEKGVLHLLLRGHGGGCVRRDPYDAEDEAANLRCGITGFIAARSSERRPR